MYMDGTAVSAIPVPSTNPNEDFEYTIANFGWNRLGIGYAIEQPYYKKDGKGFLNYDGTIAELDDPPNQHYQIFNFREHAARFAHELDAAMGHHTLASASEAEPLDRAALAVRHDRERLARRYAVWEAIDPQELIVGGEYDGTLLWKRNLQDYIDMDMALCGECEIATFARRFLFNADLPAFRSCVAARPDLYR